MRFARTPLQLISCVVFTLPACRAAPSEPGTLSAVLERARAAMDAAPAPQGLMASGRGTFMNEDSDFSLVFDSAGSFAATYAGPLSQTTGFDGAIAWERDWAGSGRVLHGGERLSNLFPTWLYNGEWVDRAQELSLEVIEGAEPTSLSFSFGGYGSSGRITLDPATGLPASATWGDGSSDSSLSFSEYRDFGPITLPSRFRYTSGSADSLTIIDTIQDAPTFIRSPYEYLGGGSPAIFDPALPAALEVKRVPTGHMLVKGAFNGRDLGWFIFDTGAGANIINNSAAAALGLEGFGGVDASGVGGSVPTRFYRLDSMTIGPATLKDAIVVGLDLNFLEGIFGEKIAGIVGYNMLSHVVAEVDMAAGAVSLFDSASYRRPGLVWNNLELIERHPSVHATFEGHDGVFRIDTGAGSDTVIFHSGTVEKLGLLDNRATVPAVLGGVGGQTPAAKGKIAEFTVAGRTHRDVDATFAKPGGKTFSDPFLAGTIGGGFFADVVMVLDYANARIGFLDRPARPGSAGH